MVNSLQPASWVSGYEAGIDSESGWLNYSKTSSWINGFNNTYTSNYISLFDTGDAALDSGKGWTNANIHYVAYGAPKNVCIPQSYYTGQANRWHEVSLYGAQSGNTGAVNFYGVLSQDGHDGGSNLQADQSYTALANSLCRSGGDSRVQQSFFSYCCLTYN